MINVFYRSYWATLVKPLLKWSDCILSSQEYGFRILKARKCCGKGEEEHVQITIPKRLCFSSKRNKRLLYLLYQKCLQKLFSVFVNQIQRRYRLINYWDLHGFIYKTGNVCPCHHSKTVSSVLRALRIASKDNFPIYEQKNWSIRIDAKTFTSNIFQD